MRLIDADARKILFRGKSTESGECLYGYYSDENGIKTEFPCIEPLRQDKVDVVSWRVYPETVGQFTGLMDKDGNKIFEGDIVEVTDDDGSTDFCDGGTGEVCFCEGLWYIGRDVNNALYDVNRCYYITVIGNIHDNPELLEGN